MSGGRGGATSALVSFCAGLVVVGLGNMRSELAPASDKNNIAVRTALLARGNFSKPDAKSPLRISTNTFKISNFVASARSIIF